MRVLAALACLCALWVTPGCFDVKYTCRILCSTEPGEGCPAGLRCLIPEGDTKGLCAPLEVKSCALAGTDAATTADADASVGPVDAIVGPPQMICQNGDCLALPEAVRSNLVLLLWPSNLPAVGSPVSLWPDQSGQGNDAHALYPTALPHVISDRVQLDSPGGVHLDSSQAGSGFVVANNTSLDFGSSDFAVVVVAGLASADKPVRIFRKSDNNRTNSRQIAIEWVLASAVNGRAQAVVNDTVIASQIDIVQPSVMVYTVRRSTDHIDLRTNGVVFGSADLPTPGSSTTNAEDVYVGVGSLDGAQADTIEAVIGVRGPITTSNLTSLEVFLRTVFATTP